MPVFARIAAADPVETASITATTTDAVDVVLEAVCTCPVSEDTTMPQLDTVLLAQYNAYSSTINSSSIDHIVNNNSTSTQLYYPHHAPVHFQGHLTTCALHSATNIPAFALLKQQALVKQKQLLLLEQRRQKLLLELQRKRDPFEYVRMMPTRTCHLYSGSKFQGRQTSKAHSYEVMVDIKHVNLNESTLCGYLHIKGLTPEYPELTTFFDAEIVGPEYSFLTRKWDANEVTDKEHWGRFPPFKSMANVFSLEDTKYDFRDKDVIFMRWKEHFLVPDHRVMGIHGASFAGFYYICYYKLTGEINGYYYHQSSEMFQQLNLGHVAERPSFGSYEFR
ncbi:GID complex subunit 4, VID24 [Mortierella claussenii]|nr:GID complex subunit 4, VID24 [Mortierella claussenii]